ncbi:unnamed protein product [Owenia fusiformis]|uniref:ATP synthase peripheral stalk subunit OSCP, mitochondrial n=1 Tax=Owenia fusiformis TaxID=6347 RepID=A0A8J1XHC4_OWEFU|nr:unnamed protein product [Owenia fusiformis]
MVHFSLNNIHNIFLSIQRFWSHRQYSTLTAMMAAPRFGNFVRQFSCSAVAQGKLAQAPVQIFGIEGRYAHAVYSAASKENKIDQLEKEFNKFRTLLKDQPKLLEVMKNPTLKRGLKRDTVEKVLKAEKFSPLTTNLFIAMADNGRLKKAPAVMDAFDTIMSAVRGEVTCTVTTAKALDAASEKALRAALNGFAKQGEKIQLTLDVDPTLIGGMVVKIGDKFVDMSMASKITTYTNLIKQAV